ncbi:MAG: hypothetical protein C5B50_20750 [Verrucomicrobia bacterium]|nr:MAG: hypothetical protein C5B50_20750 [Verrucomicrobiota bacterium]
MSLKMNTDKMPKVLLICPSVRSGVPFLAEATPLALAPLLGQGLIEYWLSWIEISGPKEVMVLAHDRPDQIETVVGDGARWGLKAKVVPEARDLSSAEALLKYGDDIAQDGTITVLDHFPGAPEGSLFTSYNTWFQALLDWMPRAITLDRVGFHETKPGIWTGTHCHICLGAQLIAPCWLGKNVLIGPGATIGPHAIVEDGSVVEASAAVTRSYIGPDTFVGEFAKTAHALAWGNTLIALDTGSAIQVADTFLLCALRSRHHQRSRGLLGRIFDICSRNREEAELLWKQLVANKEG